MSKKQPPTCPLCGGPLARISGLMRCEPCRYTPKSRLDHFPRKFDGREAFIADNGSLDGKTHGGYRRRPFISEDE